MVEAELIKQCVREVLTERATVDVETHREHHECLTEMLPALKEFLEYRKARMIEMQKRKEMLERIRNTAIGAAVVSIVGAIVAVLGWIGVVVWHAIQAGITGSHQI